MRTLYISDLDGTLLGKDAVLSPYTAAALNRLLSSGIHFSVATARTAATVTRILAELPLSVPMVLMNGVLVYDPLRKRYLKKETLDPETAKQVIETLHNYGQPAFMYTINNDEMFTYYESLRTRYMRDFYQERVRRYDKPFIHIRDFGLLESGDIIYFTLMDQYRRIKSVYDALCHIPRLGLAMYADIYVPGMWYLEVYSHAASKRTAVEYLRTYGNYDRIVGFGDNLNDLPLFGACDACYAVQNAHDELKRLATAIIGAHTSDGVAKWLEANAAVKEDCRL